MTALRIIATMSLLGAGWLFRHRPLIGPLSGFLVTVGLHRLWRGDPNHLGFLGARAYQAIHRDDPRRYRYPTVSYPATLESHRW